MVRGNQSITDLSYANGFKEVTGTENVRSFAIQAIGGSATLSATSLVGDNLSSVTIQDGAVVFGNFSAVAVTAGTVLAYKSEE